jgi:hypothetical protein
MRMMTRRTAVTAIAGSLVSAQSVIEHKVLYKETGRFGGWPANHGIWSWGDEILCGFSAAYFKRMPANRHQYDNQKPEEPRLLRTLDGGGTWTVEAPQSLLPPEQGGKAIETLREPMDFTDPGFAMTLRFTDVNKGPSRLWFTYDKGKTWHGAYDFPLFGQLGIAARTDYIVRGKREALAFVTASKKNGREGRPLCVRTTDGGLNWSIQGWIGEEPEGFSIMPSTVRLNDGALLTSVRVKKDQQTDWLELYTSKDDGKTWSALARPTAFTGGMSGNPPGMLMLKDGRVCITYGFRGEPYGIRAVLSNDAGRTWSKEIVLRSDGAAWDIGYTRSVQRPDGKIVTIYYFPEQQFTERVIAATIWNPGSKA